MNSDYQKISEKLDRLFQKTVEKRPGKQLISYVEKGDGSFRWSSSAGSAEDGSPVHEHTPFFIASIDKLINAALLIQLIEEGSVHLDSPFVDYLPESLSKDLHLYKGRDYTGSVTVRHLLTHTSGMADWYEDFPKQGKNLVEEIIKEGDRDLELSELLEYVRNRLTPNFEPQPIQSFLEGKSDGKRIKTRYTDTGFMLICAIIEAVTGQPLEDLHHARIYEPLGMKHTWLAHRTEPSEAVPSVFPLLASGKKVDIPKMLRSVWGVYSTCNDMITFFKALYAGQLFQKPATRDLMFSGWHQFGFPGDRAAVRLPGWPIAYSLGAMQFRLPRMFSPVKAMPEIVGHTGSTGCWLFYCPQLDLYMTGAADDLTAGALPFKYVPAMLKLF
ncbi:MAG: beta-lactamase family protein [Balneolaceae bacterium]|nr:beta-lactamase family protein [Balneolaceae bacterium]